MASYLLFDLFGPMAAWGEIAVGETRPTAERPTRSAILGLLAAALGVDRADEDKQQELANGLHIATLVRSGGRLLRDYHTAQHPEGKKERDHATRKDELERSRRVGTILSARDYLSGHAATCVVWKKASSAAPEVEALKGALESPHFHLYLGRKSCPLALPLGARIVSAQSLSEALQHGLDAPVGKLLETLESANSQQSRPLLRRLPEQLRDHLEPAVVRVWWDAEAGDPGEAINGLTETARWDQPLSRSRWQFQPFPEREGRYERQAREDTE